MSGLGNATIHDISVTLGTESIDYPGDTAYSRNLIMNSGDSFCNLSRLEMSCHSGTHLDVPFHFYADGKTLDDFQVTDFIKRVHVIEIMDSDRITVSEVDWSLISPGEGVLFKTRNSREGLVKSGKFVSDFVYLSPDAAKKVNECKASLVGIDYISIEQFGVEHFHSHLEVLGQDVIVLEAVNLEGITEGTYTLMCLPLKLSSADASPVRAILIED